MSQGLRPVDEIRKEVIETMAGKGISARQIMRDTGISHVTVNRFLRGEGDTRPHTIVKLCLHLGLDWHQRKGQAS
jgi:DNA-binding Xre family transcriptional regulator